MPKSIPVLNWFEGDGKWSRGLRKIFQRKIAEGEINRGPDFFTIRLGFTWAESVKPGDMVAISISNNPDKPNIIGTVRVTHTTKTWLGYITAGDLILNIGPKTTDKVLKDMVAVYGPGSVSWISEVSIIGLSRSY